MQGLFVFVVVMATTDRFVTDVKLIDSWPVSLKQLVDEIVLESRYS